MLNRRSVGLVDSLRNRGQVVWSHNVRNAPTRCRIRDMFYMDSTEQSRFRAPHNHFAKA